MSLKGFIFSIVVGVLLSLTTFSIKDNKRTVKREFKDNKYNAENSYIATLEIPKINFKRGLYPKDSPLNDVDHEIAFLTDTEYPNGTSNTVIVGHSGDSKYAYFNDLNKLEIGDLINFYYNKQKYEFIVADIYLVLKTGSVEVIKDEDKMSLTLITCYQDNYQLVIIANKKE